MESFEDWLRSNNLASIQRWADKLLELGASWDTFRLETDATTVEDLVDGGIPRLAARDIYRLAAEALKRSEAPLSIFWDLENVPIPTSVSGTQVAARLKSILAPHGQLKQFRGYASIGLNLIPEQKRSELQLSGCHLVDCPHAGRKEVADKMIIVDAMEFAFTHPEGATLCFITGDVDYAYLLAKLQRPQWTTIVISKGTIQSILHINCDMKMRWETDVLQLRLTPPQTTHVSTLEGTGEDVTPLTAHVSSFVDCDQSIASSTEALTIAEEWTDDAALLRAIVDEGSRIAGTSGTLKSRVGTMLKTTNPARFSDRSKIKAFLSKAIEEGIVVEEGEGAKKTLHLPSDFSGSAQLPISLSETAPLSTDEMPPRALELGESLPFILFIEKQNIPSGSQLPEQTFVQTSSNGNYLILMFRTLIEAQRKIASKPCLRQGVLVDWRRAKKEQNQNVIQATIETFPCASCCGLTLESKLFVEPGSEGLFCRSCFESREFWTHSEALKAQNRVVDLLRMMFDNDDVWVNRNVFRRVLGERWPIECASRGQADQWIEGAIGAGAVMEMTLSGVNTKNKKLFLPENSAMVASPFPPDDFDTSSEEAFVVGLLKDKGECIRRKELNAALKEMFPQRMDTPIIRTKVYSNAAARGAFFVAKGHKGQFVGLSKEDAKAAFDDAPDDIAILH